VCGGLLVLCLAGPALAFNVDSTADGSDANPGDGICATSALECTLRAAVEEANATPGLQGIALDDRTHVRTIASELAITDDVNIYCPSSNIARIDAAGLGRVLHVHPGASVSLSNVVVMHGADNSPEGGAGILNEGELTTYRVVIFENTGSVAAGIRNTGTVSMDASGIGNNGPGPAMLNDGYADLHDVSIGLNDGVGLYNRDRADLEFVEIGHNDGGGILNSGPGPMPANIDLLNSTLVGNGGPGALAGGLVNVGRAVLRKSTVSGNRGTNASAIYSSGFAGELQLENVTIAANGSPLSPAAAVEATGDVTVRVVNTIIGGNASSMSDPDCRATVTSLGHNLMSCTLTAPDPTTLTGDPRVAPLIAVPVIWPSGLGTTFVHPLLPGSPAIDTGGGCVFFPDQRGGDRPQGGGCDIGAFENTPLCKAGVEMGETRLVLRRRADGKAVMKVKGQLLFADPLDPVVDPAVDGFQLRIEDLGSPGGSLLERTVYTRPMEGPNAVCAGWRSLGTVDTWRSAAAGECSSVAVGRLRVRLNDRRASEGVIDLKMTVATPLPPVSAPIGVTIALGTDTLEGNLAGDADECASHVFVCTLDATGTRYRCE
jgi:CSLREA domain-containing protein